MDLEYYRDFLTIVEEGTISGAARRLNIAQPALSNRLRQLEAHVNTPLLETSRGSRNIVLTEAGEYLYREAKYLLASEDNIKREVSNRAKGLAGILRISLSPSTAMMFIRDYLVPFSRAFPQIQYHVNEVNIVDQTRQLIAGETEIGVANAPLLQPDKFRVLFRRAEKLLVAASRESKWPGVKKKAVTLHDLADMPIVLSLGCSELVLSVCRRMNFTPRVLSICTTRSAALIWARENRALAIVPEQAMQNYEEDLTYSSINAPDLQVHQSIVIVRDRSLTKVARNFLEFHDLPV